MSSTPHFAFVVTYVTDIEAATRFYVDVMGLTAERTAPTFVQFDHFAIASDEPMASDGKPELYWEVDDAEAAFRDLSQQANVSLPLTQKPFGTVFGITDHDGRPRYVVEFARERPSQRA